MQELKASGKSAVFSISVATQQTKDSVVVKNKIPFAT